jgi:2-haloacid dehalogenase
VVFDVGHVLIHYDPELAFLDLIPDPAERRAFLETVCTAAWNREQDRGRPWAEAEATLLAEHPGEAARIRAFRRNWLRMVPHALDGTVAIFLDLVGRGADVTLLTNFAADTFTEARQRYAFLDRARGATVSGEVGLIKPDGAIFDLHATRFGLAPERTLFIDDMEPNVLGARAAGWHAVRFTGAAALRDDLAALGVLAAEDAPGAADLSGR